MHDFLLEKLQRCWMNYIHIIPLSESIVRLRGDFSVKKSIYEKCKRVEKHLGNV